MNADIAALILAELKTHRGLENAITAPVLGILVGLNERDVRKTIALHFRDEEWSACGLLLSRPGHGFFFATDSEEVAHRRAILMSLELEARTKRALFETEMRRHGFGGLITSGPPLMTFPQESHPEPDQTQRRKDAEERREERSVLF